MKTLNRVALLAAVAGLGGMFGAAQQFTPGTTSLTGFSRAMSQADRTMPNRDASRATSLKAMLGGGRFSGKIKRRYPGVGWSVAQDRRMAKKRRNQTRNRRAQRRAGS